MSSDADDKINGAVGQRLRALREKAGISQIQLGEACGVSGPAVSNYESGKRLISVVFLYRAATCIGVHPAAILLDPSEVDEVGALLRDVGNLLHQD